MARFGPVLGTFMILAGRGLDWAGKESAWFAVTSLVWGSIIVCSTRGLTGRRLSP